MEKKDTDEKFWGIYLFCPSPREGREEKIERIKGNNVRTRGGAVLLLREDDLYSSQDDHSRCSNRKTATG